MSQADVSWPKTLDICQNTVEKWQTPETCKMLVFLANEASEKYSEKFISSIIFSQINYYFLV